jgi:hypothetical protein
MEKSVLLPADLSLESTKICLIYIRKEMKLTYEQMRMLAQLGPANDRIIVKNKKGNIIKPNIKWDQNPNETRFTSMAAPPRPFLARMENHSLTCLHPSSSPPLRPRGRR